MTHVPEPVAATSVPASKGKSNYPSPFDARVLGRAKHKLGDVFGLANFGVNLTTLDPGAVSALFHAHSAQDEFVYVLEGSPTLLLADAEYELSPGQCIGFKAGTGLAHQLINRTELRACFIEVGDRSSGDQVTYPNDDLQAVMTAAGQWKFRRKDNSPY